MNLSKELRQLHEQDSDVRDILDTFGELERVYYDTLEAMGVMSQHTPQVMNSADVTLSFHPAIPSAHQ